MLAPDDVWAASSSTDEDGPARPYLLHWDGGDWRPADPPADAEGQLHAVAAAPDGTLWAAASSPAPPSRPSPSGTATAPGRTTRPTRPRPRLLLLGRPRPRHRRALGRRLHPAAAPGRLAPRRGVVHPVTAAPGRRGTVTGCCCPPRTPAS
ncbi:hypothetical protein ACFQ1I_31860 [Kitasatospora arboriphila]